MFPMLWLWSPRIYLPWSGSVKQDLELDHFFDAIPAAAGDGAIEGAAFRRASYGRQLGWLTEVLLETMKDVPADEKSPLGKLRWADEYIQRLKREQRKELSGEQIANYLNTLRASDGARYAQLSAQLRPLLERAGDGGA